MATSSRRASKRSFRVACFKATFADTSIWAWAQRAERPDVREH
jgi:hypothetical protein